jgi:hypothetical protein
MSMRSWLRNLFTRPTAHLFHKVGPPHPKRVTHRCFLEQLESRDVPSTLIDNSTVTVLPSSTPEFPGYPQADAIDTGPN